MLAAGKIDVKGSRGIMPVGNLILRFKYPDGRITAVISIDNDWKVEVFANKEEAEKFAKDNELTVREMDNADNP